MSIFLFIVFIYHVTLCFAVIWFFNLTGAKKEWCFLCEFERLILKGKDGGSALSPIGILSQIQKIGSHLSSGREEDAHEFLRLDLFQDSLFFVM